LHSSIAFFLQFRKRVTSSYSELFGEADEDGEQSRSVDDFSETSQFARQWGWYQSLYALAKGDVTKFDEITGYQLTKCLTYLTFEKQKNEIERRQLERQLRR
jgi:hypothetical protein